MDAEMKAIKTEMRLVVSTIINNIKIILLCGLLGAFASLFTLLIPIDVMYNAHSAVSVTIYEENYDNTRSIRILRVLMDLYDSSMIRDRVLEISGNPITIKQLDSMANVGRSSSSTLLTINTRHNNPAVAIEIANAIAHVLFMEADRLFETATGIKVLDNAYDVKIEYTGAMIRIAAGLLITFLSMVGACIYFIVKTLSSDKVLFIEDCTMDGTLEILGVIPFAK